MGTRLAAYAVGLSLPAALSLPVAAAPLVADLSSREIAITTGFSGTDLLLFGSMDGAGDVIVVVRGPPRREVVRHKIRVAGIWLNGESVAFNDVPGFYFVAASRPVEQIAADRELKRRQIGVSRLALPAVAAPTSQPLDDFRAGLIRALQDRALYSEMPAPVRIVENSLFRTEIPFPANVPTGVFTAEVYLFRDGQEVIATRTPVIVRKAGMEARIYDFAHEQSALYGIVAIVFALVAGWLAGVVFRKT